MKIDLHPKVCPICGGKVILTKTVNVYGRDYGSGWCYYCTKCKAATSTHKSRPDEAIGILADKETKLMRMKCHDFFDKIWENKNDRRKCYVKLAKELGIEPEYCHFGYMDLETLNKAYEILKRWWKEKYDI